MAAHQHFMNLSVTNVPGPPRPLYLAGAELLEVFPVIPISVNLTLGVGALSYNGQFNITAVADRDACPDVSIRDRGTGNPASAQLNGSRDISGSGAWIWDCAFLGVGDFCAWFVRHIGYQEFHVRVYDGTACLRPTRPACR